MRDLPLDPDTKDTISRTPVLIPNPPAGLTPNPPAGLTPNPPAGLTPNPPAGLTPNPPQRKGSLPQAPLTQARAPGPVNPALLGDNPFSASANAQIAARLQES